MTRSLLSLAAVAAVSLSVTAADLKVKVGDPFPNIPLPAAQADKVPGKAAGDKVSIADFKGKTVVVFFYPKALTPGCTTESCGFRDMAKDLPKDAVLLGASADTVAKQQEFIDKHTLPYPLLADTDLKLIDALGIRMGKGKVPQRVTFVVDKEGKIAKIYDKVTPKSHPADVLKYVDALK